MFVFYGPAAVATGYRDIIGISVDPTNVGCHKTHDTSDPAYMHFAAYPLQKPAMAEAWVFIPDEVSWIGKSTGYPNEGGFTDPVYLVSLRPVSEGMSCSYTELIADPVTVKIGKHGVCFYNNDSKYVMLGYCPPNSNTDVLFTSGWSQHSSGSGGLAYCPVIVSSKQDTFDGPVVNYTLTGLPNVTTMSWTYNNGAATSGAKIVKVFMELGSTVSTYSGNTEVTLDSGTTLSLYEIYYMTGLELARLIKEAPEGLIIGESAGTGDTAVKGQFVVR